MHTHLANFILHWGITALALWAASLIFKGIKFADTPSLVGSALLLGFANAIVQPILVLVTFPLTLMIKLVSALVKGFTVSSFWTAFFASIFIALLSMFIGGFFQGTETGVDLIQIPRAGPWI